MIRFKELQAKNFMSFGNVPVTLNLDTKNIRSIMGNNEDIGPSGESANGVGKTALFNALVFALFGTPVDKKLKPDSCVNFSNGKNMSVSVIFSRGDDVYKVVRGRSPNIVSLYKINSDGSEDSMTLDAKRNTDDEIIRILGFDYNIFMLAFFMSPHKPSFMSMTGPEQREMIENMLSLNVLAERAATIKELSSATSIEQRIAEKEFERVLESNQKLNARLSKLRESDVKFNEEKEQKLKDIDKYLEENSLDFDEIYQIFDEIEDIERSGEELFNREQLLSQKASNSQKAQYSAIELKRKIDELTASVLIDVESLEALQPGNPEISAEVMGELEDTLEQAHDVNNAAMKTNSLIENAVNLINRNQDKISHRLEKRQEIVVSIAEHESGKCAVCGGDYVNPDKILALQNELSSLDSEISSLQAGIDESRTLASKPQQQLIDVQELNKTVRNYREKQREYEVKVTKFESVERELVRTRQNISSLEDDLSRLGDLDELIKEATAHQEELQTITGMIDELEQKHQRVSEKLSSKSSHQTRSSLDDVRVLVEKYQSERERVANSTSTVSELIEVTESDIVDTTELERSLHAMEKLQQHRQYVVNLLTNRKSFVRRRILDNYMPFLNKCINEHTSFLGMPHVCEVNNDLSVSLMYMNKEASYYNLSRGERLRLDMATTRAFRQMMEMQGKGCNLTLVDEMLDSALDKAGVMQAMRFICDSTETVLLITHREELRDSIEDKILVTKRNGFGFIDG